MSWSIPSAYILRVPRGFEVHISKGKRAYASRLFGTLDEAKERVFELIERHDVLRFVPVILQAGERPGLWTAEIRQLIELVGTV